MIACLNRLDAVAYIMLLQHVQLNLGICWNFSDGLPNLRCHPARLAGDSLF